MDESGSAFKEQINKGLLEREWHLCEETFTRRCRGGANRADHIVSAITVTVDPLPENVIYLP
jgi:hypothetical protein